MQKFLLTLLFALLAVPSLSFAASDDVTLTTDVVINVAGINLTISGSSAATMASIVVNSDSFDIGLEFGSSITVVSSDRRIFTLSPSPSSGAFTQSTDCTSSESTLILSGTGTITVTVTPTSSTCTVASSGGGGGGGSSAPYQTAPAGGFTLTADTANSQNKTILHFGFGNDITNIAISDNINFTPASHINVTNSIEWTVPTTKIVYVKYCNKYSRCSNPISVQINPVTSVSTPIVSNSYKFYRNLAYKMTGPDVLELQKYLNANGFVLAQNGVGSVGKETNYFGHLTERAVQKFQAQYGIVSSGSPAMTGYGLVGPRTRAKLNELLFESQ